MLQFPLTNVPVVMPFKLDTIACESDATLVMIPIAELPKTMMLLRAIKKSEVKFG